jgi:hypothetical protein
MMTLQEWRQSKFSTEWLNKVLATAEGRLFLELLNDIHPRHFQIVSSDPNESTAALNKIYGYDLCLNNINAMRTFDPPVQELEATFGAEQIAPMPLSAPIEPSSGPEKPASELE